jgi:hypothetical protein
MHVTNELEIFGNKNELEFYYEKFNFEFIKKHPSYLTYYSDIKDWRYKNWGTETEMKTIHKNVVCDKIEQKLSIRFETNYPPIKIINHFAEFAISDRFNCFKKPMPHFIYNGK